MMICPWADWRPKKDQTSYPLAGAIKEKTPNERIEELKQELIKLRTLRKAFEQPVGLRIKETEKWVAKQDEIDQINDEKLFKTHTKTREDQYKELIAKEKDRIVNAKMHTKKNLKMVERKKEEIKEI